MEEMRQRLASALICNPRIRLSLQHLPPELCPIRVKHVVGVCVCVPLCISESRRSVCCRALSVYSSNMSSPSLLLHNSKSRSTAVFSACGGPELIYARRRSADHNITY